MAHITSFDGHQIYYTIKKGRKKPALFFIHGLSGNHSVWSHNLKHFSKLGYTVVALDLFGHGNSHKTTDRYRYTITHFARDINTIVNHENIKDFIFIGHSLGAVIGFEYDRLYPKKAKGHITFAAFHGSPLKYLAVNLSLFTPFVWGFAWTVAQITKRIKRRHYPFIDYTKLGRHNSITIMFWDLVGTPMNAYFWTVLSMLDFDISHHLKRMKQPVLLIAGEKDETVRKEAAYDLKKMLKNSHVKVLKASDHLNPIRRPKLLNGLIEEFITQWKSR